MVACLIASIGAFIILLIFRIRRRCQANTTNTSMECHRSNTSSSSSNVQIDPSNKCSQTKKAKKRKGNKNGKNGQITGPNRKKIQCKFVRGWGEIKNIFPFSMVRIKIKKK